MFCIKGQFLGEKYVTILNSNKVKVYIIEECHLEKKKKKKKSYIQERRKNGFSCFNVLMVPIAIGLECRSDEVCNITKYSY